MPIPYIYTSSIWEEHPHGYPLYRPEPAKSLPSNLRRKGIRIGDVGLITQDGSFDFLFNVCKAAINPERVPDNFEMVDSEPSVLDFFPADTHLSAGAAIPTNWQGLVVTSIEHPDFFLIAD